MSKVTSKLQVTVPKAIADRYGIRPGDEIGWEPAGEAILVVPLGHRKPRLSVAERLRIFDEATQRQRAHEARMKSELGKVERPQDRGWTREDAYRRGGAD